MQPFSLQHWIWISSILSCPYTSLVLHASCNLWIIVGVLGDDWYRLQELRFQIKVFWNSDLWQYWEFHLSFLNNFIVVYFVCVILKVSRHNAKNVFILPGRTSQQTWIYAVRYVQSLLFNTWVITHLKYSPFGILWRGKSYFNSIEKLVKKCYATFYWI